MQGAALLVCAGALAATVRGPPALEGALVQPTGAGDGPRLRHPSSRLVLSSSGGCALSCPIPPLAANCLIATMRCWPQAGFAFQHWLLPRWWSSDDPPTSEQGGALLKGEEMAKNDPKKFVPA